MADNTTSYLDKLNEHFTNFYPFSREEWEYIKQFCIVRTFEKRQLIIDKGEVEEYFNILIKGLARKYILAGRKEVTQQLATEGHIIHSEISFVTRTPSPVIIETLEPTILVSIKYDDVQKLFELLPNMEKIGRLLITDLFIKKDYKDFNFLNKTTRERFLEYVQTHPHILQRVPQKYIASYLDIKPETFSRLKHLLQKKR